MKSRVTIKDIAQKTGFSVTTISLVLNDKANHIPRETKLIIAKAVKEMGYRPNKMAVGLVKKQSNIIGFVLPDIRNQFFSDRKSTRLNSSHVALSRMPSSA